MAAHYYVPVTAFALVSFYLFPANAQLDTPVELGVTAGTFIYQGDLTPSPFGSRRTASYAFGLTCAKKITDAISVRAEFNTGRLRGDEGLYDRPEWRRYRAFRFSTPIQEAALYLVIFPFGNGHVSPYVVTGAGVAFLDIERDPGRFTHDYFQQDVIEGLQKDLEKEVPQILPVLPSGFGLKYQLRPNISLSLEAKYRIMFTDYLDGFSYSAEPEMNDHYITYSIGFSYCRSRSKNSCPVF